MRRTKSLLLISALFALNAAPAHASLFNGIATEVTQVAGWAMQYTQMLREYEQLVEQYRSLNGIRGMANLVNDPNSRKYLPRDFQIAVNSGYGNWSSLLQIMNSEARMTAEQRFAKVRRQIAIDEAMTSEAYRQASVRFESIQVLLDRVNQTPDAKDIADLAGRIQAEQVMLQNEQNKIAMMLRMQDLLTRRSNQMSTDNAIRRLTIQPISNW